MNEKTIIKLRDEIFKIRKEAHEKMIKNLSTIYKIMTDAEIYRLKEKNEIHRFYIEQTPTSLTFLYENKITEEEKKVTINAGKRPSYHDTFFLVRFLPLIYRLLEEKLTKIKRKISDTNITVEANLYEYF